MRIHLGPAAPRLLRGFPYRHSGSAWRPYVYYDWQPYTRGHWIHTRYGPTWQGYEPWAWVAYHYGNWIWTQRLRVAEYKSKDPEGVFNNPVHL